jgi:hypothetical protein
MFSSRKINRILVVAASTGPSCCREASACLEQKGNPCVNPSSQHAGVVREHSVSGRLHERESRRELFGAKKTGFIFLELRNDRLQRRKSKIFFAIFSAVSLAINGYCHLFFKTLNATKHPLFRTATARALAFHLLASDSGWTYRWNWN